MTEPQLILAFTVVDVLNALVVYTGVRLLLQRGLAPMKVWWTAFAFTTIIAALYFVVIQGVVLHWHYKSGVLGTAGGIQFSGWLFANPGLHKKREK